MPLKKVEVQLKAMTLMMQSNLPSVRAKCVQVRQQLAQEGISVHEYTIYRWTNSNPLVRRQTKRVLKKRVRTEENINRVKFAIENCGAETLMRQLAIELGIPFTTIWKIIRKDSKLFSYKYQKGQLLTKAHKVKRKKFCEDMLALLEQNPDCYKKIIFSDETAKESSPSHNSQNQRVLSSQQPH